ncbi:MAG: zinc ABC transporter substrate-binding protein [Clostridia bacterium]|nr:zinc ABC transporter substrate-binding protein [Clostridia bacterium]
MKKNISFFLLVCLLLSLSGCGAIAEDVTVMVTFYPVYVLAENVLQGVDGVRLLSMTAPSTGCLHDYQLLPRDMRALASASMLLINGAGMETFLPDIEGQYKNLTIVDCSSGVELLAEEDHGEGEDDHDHDHGEYNAHIWLDAQNAIQMVNNMTVALTELLPGQAEKIRRNAQEYTQMLTNLDDELRAATDALPRKQIVTFHEAFPYFARAYGLEVVAVVALEPDEPISPRMLSEAIEKVKTAGNPPLFSEPQYENKALKTIAQETGAPVYELDPLVTGDAPLTAYQDTMRHNLAVLQEALGN